MSSRSPGSPEPAVPPPAREDGPAASLRRCRPALGTLVDLHLSGLPPARLERALAAAFAEIARCEAALSAHLPDNDLARLRTARPGAVRALDPRTCAVLRHAARMARASDDAFDPRRAVAADAPAFADTFRLLPQNRVRLAGPLDLDLGGIAKGLALDRALAMLRRARMPAACLNAGGDLRIHGLGVRLRLRHPLGTGEFFDLGTLHSGAATTSAQTFRRHLRAPRSRQTAPRSLSFTVLAPLAWSADALTKVVALAPPATAVRLLARHRAHAAIVDSAGGLRWLPGPPPATVLTP